MLVMHYIVATFQIVMWKSYVSSCSAVFGGASLSVMLSYHSRGRVFPSCIVQIDIELKNVRLLQILLDHISEVTMWECLFLLLLSLSSEHVLGQELTEGYCESENYSEGRNISGIIDCGMNSFSNEEYTGVHNGDSRTGLSSTPDSKLMLINSKIGKVASSLSEVNVKGALSRMWSSLKAAISNTVMSNPSLVAGLRTVERSAKNIKTVGELVVFKTRGVTFKLVQDLNAGFGTMKNGLENNFDQVNQLWQTVKSWLDSGDRQGRFTASSSFRELSAFIRDFHWLRGEERGGKVKSYFVVASERFCGGVLRKATSIMILSRLSLEALQQFVVMGGRRTSSCQRQGSWGARW